MPCLCRFIHANYSSSANDNSTSHSFAMEINNENSNFFRYIDMHNPFFDLERISHSIFKGLLISRYKRRQIDRIIDWKLVSVQKMFLKVEFINPYLHVYDVFQIDLQSNRIIYFVISGIVCQ